MGIIKWKSACWNLLICICINLIILFNLDVLGTGDLD
jgi:hypothetical protein